MPIDKRMRMQRHLVSICQTLFFRCCLAPKYLSFSQSVGEWVTFRFWHNFASTGPPKKDRKVRWTIECHIFSERYDQELSGCQNFVGRRRVVEWAEFFLPPKTYLLSHLPELCESIQLSLILWSLDVWYT